MRINLNRIFKKVKKLSGNKDGYLVIIPYLMHRTDEKFNLQMYFNGKLIKIPPDSDMLFKHKGRKYLLADDFYGYSGDKSNKTQIKEFLDSFGSFAAYGDSRHSYLTVWFKRWCEDV